MKVLSNSLVGLVVALLALPLPVLAQDVTCDQDGFDGVNRSVYHSYALKNSQSKSRLKNNGVFARRSTVYPLQVVSVAGDVQFERANRIDMVGKGQYLYLNDVVITGSSGFISLRLGDNGAINILPPNSRVRLLQVNPYVARYELLEGRVESQVIKSPSAKKSTFEIRLPTVSVGVRGTHFSVAYDSVNGVMKAEVKEGLVKVQRRNVCTAPLFLSAGQATRLDMTPWQAYPLLEAPKLVNPGASQRGKNLNFAVNLVMGAKNYVVQIAKDAAFLDVQKQFESSQTTISLEEDDGLRDGYYYVRLMAEDNLGLRGRARQYVFLRNRRDLY